MYQERLSVLKKVQDWDLSASCRRFLREDQEHFPTLESPSQIVHEPEDILKRMTAVPVQLGEPDRVSLCRSLQRTAWYGRPSLPTNSATTRRRDA